MELRKIIAIKTRLLFRIFIEYIRDNPCPKDDQLRYQIRMRIDRLEIVSAHPDELHEVTYFIIDQLFRRNIISDFTKNDLLLNFDDWTSEQLSVELPTTIRYKTAKLTKEQRQNIKDYVLKLTNLEEFYEHVNKIGYLHLKNTSL